MEVVQRFGGSIEITSDFEDEIGCDKYLAMRVAILPPDYNSRTPEANAVRAQMENALRQLEAYMNNDFYDSTSESWFLSWNLDEAENWVEEWRVEMEKRFPDLIFE